MKTSTQRILLLCAGLLIGTSGASSLAQSSAVNDATRVFYRGDYAHAAELAQAHLRTHPNDAAMQVLLARAELAQGDFQHAFEALQKALAAKPNDTDALYYLSLIARELSHQEYQRLFALAPDSARAHQLLAEAALAAENKGDAEREFAAALKANPHSAEIATEFAELKRSQSKFDEAITYYTQSAQIDPLKYENAYGLGACYTYKQNYPEAVKWLRKAVALQPDSAAARFALGNALFQNAQLEAAIPELNAALRLEPRLKQAYFLLGRAYSRLGRTEEAKAALKKLDEMNRAEVPTTEAAPQENQNLHPDKQ